MRASKITSFISAKVTRLTTVVLFEPNGTIGRGTCKMGRNIRKLSPKLGGADPGHDGVALGV